MTNAMIILLESIKLLEQGVIKGTGQKIKVEDDEGNVKELDMPEPIHTYATWKSLGYQVKKGQKAVASFPIWKYVSKVSKETAQAVDETDTEHTEGTGKMFMKVAAFFTAGQVEAINK